MKNIYLIKLKEVDYDEYDGWVVIAESPEEATKLCDIYDTYIEARRSWRSNQFKDNISFIKLIGTTEQEESGIVLSSYNAG